MTDDRLFSLVALLAILIWLVGRGYLPNPRHRRLAEVAAMVLVGAAVLYALLQTLGWFAGGG